MGQMVDGDITYAAITYIPLDLQTFGQLVAVGFKTSFEKQL